MPGGWADSTRRADLPPVARWTSRVSLILGAIIGWTLIAAASAGLAWLTCQALAWVL